MEHDAESSSYIDLEVLKDQIRFSDDIDFQIHSWFDENDLSETSKYLSLSAQLMREDKLIK